MLTAEIGSSIADCDNTALVENEEHIRCGLQWLKSRALYIAVLQLPVHTLLYAVLMSHFLFRTYSFLYMLMLLITVFQFTILPKTFESVRVISPTHALLHSPSNGTFGPSIKTKININMIRDS